MPNLGTCAEPPPPRVAPEFPLTPGLQEQHGEGCCARQKQEKLTPTPSNEGVSLLSSDAAGLFKTLVPMRAENCTQPRRFFPDARAEQRSCDPPKKPSQRPTVLVARFVLKKKKRGVVVIEQNHRWKAAAERRQDCERQVLLEDWKMPPLELWLFLLENLRTPPCPPCCPEKVMEPFSTPHLHGDTLVTPAGISDRDEVGALEDAGRWDGSGGRSRQPRAQLLLDANPPEPVRQSPSHPGSKGGPPKPQAGVGLIGISPPRCPWPRASFLLPAVMLDRHLWKNTAKKKRV